MGYFNVRLKGSEPTEEFYGDSSPAMHNAGMGGWDYLASGHVRCARRP